MKTCGNENTLPYLQNALVVRKRGRPKKANQPDDKSRSCWFGEVFINDGWAWGTELVGVKPGKDETERWEAIPLCLGKEEDIVPVLKVQAQIPDDIHPRRRALLESILEVNGRGGIETNSRTAYIQRRSRPRTARHKQKDTRRLKARQGLSFRKAHHKVKGVPGR
jgi:hypothetical protein